MRSASGRGRRLAGGAAAFAAVGLAASPAWAHGSASLGDFYSGLSQPVYHLESLLLLLAFGLCVGQHTERPQLAALVTFVGATLAGSAAGLLDVTIPGALWSVRLGTIALGLLTAASWFPPLWLAIVLGGVLGVAQGNFGSAGDSALIARPVVFSLGLGVGPILVTSWFVALADRFRARWLEIGFRVVGSWLATIAMLIASLAAARPAP